MSNNPIPPVTSIMSLSDFKEVVHRMRNEQTEGFRTNRFPWQSAVIFDELFDLAIKDKLPLTLFSGMTETGYYDQLRPNCQKVLDVGANVCLVFAQPLTQEQREYWAPHNEKSANLKVYERAAYQRIPHFMLVGDRSYRLEEEHPQDVSAPTDYSPPRPARFSFNDPFTGEKLKHYTDALIRSSRLVRL